MRGVYFGLLLCATGLVGQKLKLDTQGIVFSPSVGDVKRLFYNETSAVVRSTAVISVPGLQLDEVSVLESCDVSKKGLTVFHGNTIRICDGVDEWLSIGVTKV